MDDEFDNYIILYCYCQQNLYFFHRSACRFTIDVLQMIKKYTVTPFCVIVKVPPKTIDRRNRI